jgi:hypothetical protein
MRDTSRRVNAVTPISGAGTGAAIALICLESVEQTQASLDHARNLIDANEGVLSIRALCPDPILSTPLPSEDLSTRKLDPYLVIEATTIANAESAGKWLAQKLLLPSGRTHSFKLLWDLQSIDLEH